MFDDKRPSFARRHPALVITAHWATVGLIVVGLGAVLAREAIDDDGPRALLLGLHRQAGLAVLALLLVRLVGRAAHARSAAPATPALPHALQRLAAASHAALYAALVALPVLGWALSDARGQHPAAFGLIRLPVLVPTDPDLADTLEPWHQLAAWALGALVALHAAAALWHHWVRRDDVLRGMWPASRPHRALRSSPPSMES